MTLEQELGLRRIKQERTIDVETVADIEDVVIEARLPRGDADT